MTNVQEIKNLSSISSQKNHPVTSDNYVNLFKKTNCPFELMHCNSSYPLKDEEANLKCIPMLKKRYDCPIGHSDHTPVSEIPPYAVCAGAHIIEKHFTDNPKHRLSDNFFSITENDLKVIRFNIDQVSTFIHSPDFNNNDPEKFMRSFRK